MVRIPVQRCASSTCGDSRTAIRWSSSRGARKAFPLIKDLVVDRSAFDRIIQAGGYTSVNVGGAQDANSILISRDTVEHAMDSAACIGCGACVAACKNASAVLFTSAKVSHLALLPQGQVERETRVVSMVERHDAEGFGSCSNEGECEAVCPKEISITNIARMNREYFRAMLVSETVDRPTGSEIGSQVFDPSTTTFDAQTFMTSVSSFTAAADFLSAASSSGRQLDLDDLLDAARAKLHRYADEQVSNAVLALQEDRARQDLLLVLENDLDHLRRRRSRRVPRARARPAW